MRKLLRTLAILAIVLALVPLAQASPAAAQPETHPDDELVVITSDGRLVVHDRNVPVGFLPVEWESQQTGYSQVATGDFNGDGTDEIVGLRGGEAFVFDPVPMPGEPDTEHRFVATSLQTWRRVVTGDLDGDGADEIILVESSSVTGLAIQMYAFQFSVANGWTQTYGAGFGAGWVGLATGDMMGNGRDQVIGIRNPGSLRQIIIFNPADNWRTIHERNYNFPWVAVAVGNVQADSGNREEIVTTRSGVATSFQSMLAFRWVPGSVTLQDVGGDWFFPEFRWIALADVNGNGNRVVYLLRSGIASGTSIVALTSRRFSPDPAFQFNELTGQSQWNGIQAGDIDGDSRDELIVMSPSAYLIYNEPATSNGFTAYTGSFISTGSFAVGNFDGPGRPAGPTLAVSPLSVNINLDPGQGATRTVEITNAGIGTFDWVATVAPGAPWLTVSPTGGTAPSTLLLQIDTTGLPDGRYTGNVEVIAGANVANSPQTISVTINVGLNYTYLPLILRIR